MGQRQSYRSRVSTVLGFLGLGFLGLVMLAAITPAARAETPPAKSAPMCWRYENIGAWLTAFNAAGMRRIGGDARGSARCPIASAARDRKGHARTSELVFERHLLTTAQGASAADEALKSVVAARRSR
jgi:hypothetical protein